jgi:hypothetical protein
MMVLHARKMMTTITEIAGGAVVRSAGEFHIDEMIDAKRDVAKKYPGGVPWLFIVVDLSEVTSLNAQTAEIERLVEQDRLLAALTRPRLPFAVIAPQDSYYGVARMWQSISDEIGWDTQIFRDRPKTEIWIREQVQQKYNVALPNIDPNSL